LDPESVLDSELVVLSRLASFLLIPSGFNIAEESTPRALRWIPKASVPPLALAPKRPASSRESSRHLGVLRPLVRVISGNLG